MKATSEITTRKDACVRVPIRVRGPGKRQCIRKVDHHSVKVFCFHTESLASDWATEIATFIESMIPKPRVLNNKYSLMDHSARVRKIK